MNYNIWTLMVSVGFNAAVRYAIALFLCPFAALLMIFWLSNGRRNDPYLSLVFSSVFV
jgi:hypothetical protein